MTSSINKYYKASYKFKKRKYYLLSALIFVFGITFSVPSNSYRMSIEEINKLDEFRVSFSVYIENLGDKFELSSYQCVFSIKGNIDNSNLSFKYVEGSSELNNKPKLMVGVKKNHNSPQLLFASLPGYDSIIEKTLVGTFILDAELEDNIHVPLIYWDFEGNARTIVSGSEFNNVTNSSNHKIISSLSKNLFSGTDEKNELKFELIQNYPNPFNNFTRIRFVLEQKRNVLITIYNILGEPVKQFINKELKKGYHEIDINSAELTSGIYFYRIIAGDFIKTKKMLLLK